MVPLRHTHPQRGRFGMSGFPRRTTGKGHGLPRSGHHHPVLPPGRSASGLAQPRTHSTRHRMLLLTVLPGLVLLWKGQASTAACYHRSRGSGHPRFCLGFRKVVQLFCPPQNKVMEREVKRSPGGRPC
ncbi:hypothetical protein CEXT_325401 [Caerostris extrusa]|uniref:Uncharacterized protein n=1 Tax=Caerostris extrusa TaxID=172846 RepID=A0AAV4TLH0_CAEEX|nr:hypothetical protein CEXT_325401 [Caerostris extrusa]